MISKKISQLPTGSTTPSLSGVTAFVQNGVTYQLPLSTLRQTLVNSGSHIFTGSQVINGNLTVSGSLTAQEYIISSSYINITTEGISGSTLFGNTLDDTHRFTGSVNITGSLSINGTSYTAATSGTSGTNGSSGTSGDSIFVQNGPFWYTTNDVEITGSLKVTGGITGSFEGTSSWAQNSVSSSYPFYVNENTILSHNTSNISSNNSTFIGLSAGFLTTNANLSNFIGSYAGASANDSSGSNFIGEFAGYNATYAYNSNFIGRGVGYNCAYASYSTLLGYNVGFTSNNSLTIGSNNIIIGTNITLENNRKDSINIGGILFGSGSYSTTTGNPFSGSANGRIGINQPIPLYPLDVSGSMRQNNGYVILQQVSQSLNFVDDSAAQAGGVPLGGLYRNGNVIQIRIS